MLTKKFNDSLKSILEYSTTFCNFYKEKYKDHPDLIYCILSFEKFISTLSMDFALNRITTSEELHSKIFGFDHIISSWRENLAHYIPTETKTNNDIYAVLFAILQSIESVFEENIEVEDIKIVAEYHLDDELEPDEIEKHFPD